MKKAALLLALLIILVACQSRTTPAPVSVTPPLSATPSPSSTPTPNATERYQGTLQANQMQNAGYVLTQAVKGTSVAQTRTAAPTSTIAPTITPTFTPSPTPAPLSVSNYQLATPDQSVLIPLVMRTIYEEGGKAFTKTLDYEWKRSFSSFDTNEFDLSSLPKENAEEGLYFWNMPYRPDSFYDFLAGITKNAINRETRQLIDTQSIIEDGFTITPYQVEIDGDNAPEWLVFSDFDDISTSVWLVLDQTGAGQYRQLHSEIQGDSGFFTTSYELARLQDFTGDGFSDIVIVRSAYYGGGTESLDFQFLQGSPDGFELVYQVADGNNSPYDEITYDWIMEENNTPVLKITNDKFIYWCREVTYREFVWLKSGVEERPVSNLPTSADCAIARATYDSQDNLAMIGWLETALEMDAANPQLSLENLVYVHYRLALAYALERNDPKTRSQLIFISDMAEDASLPIAVKLTNQIQPLMAENKILPYPLCQASQAIALPILDYGLVYSYYPYEGYPDGYPTPLCDIASFQREVLDHLVITSQKPVQTVLEDAGFLGIDVQSAFLSPTISGWVVIIQTQLFSTNLGGQISDQVQNIPYFYFEDIGWHSLGRFFLDTPIKWFNEDITGDGIAELAFAQPDDNNCDENQDGYDLSLVSSIGNSWLVSVDEQVLCIPISSTSDWTSILHDQNGDGLVDWLVDDYFADYDLGLLINYPPPTPIIFDWWKQIRPLTNKPYILNALDDQFFTSPTPSLLRPDLEFYRTRWGMDADPVSEQIYAHLTYLLALTYELEGDEPQAVALFYDIWANHPDTLWAYLAAARLELKP